MPSQSKKRDIAEFFKPFPRNLSSNVPRKRPAQAILEDDGDTIIIKTRTHVPKTPAISVSFKNPTPTPKADAQPAFSPTSEASLPIRSPRSEKFRAPTSTKQRTPLRIASPLRNTPSSEEKPSTSFAFSDISERSQNVVREGVLVAVRDSDEDTDDSLESLSEIFKRNEKNGTGNASASSPSEDGGMEAERSRILSKFTHGRSVPIVGKDRLRALHAREKASKFDLSKILNDHQGAERTEEVVRNARLGSDTEEDGRHRTELNKTLLESIVRNADHEADNDDVSRLLNAVERTEALAGEKTYSFFDHHFTVDMDESMDEDFPEAVIPHNLWRSTDRDGCSRAYLSGFMAEEAARGNLADEALRWTFNQIAIEFRDDLRQAYIQTLQAAKSYWTRLNLTASDVQTVFHTLGGHKDALRDNSIINSRHQPLKNNARRDTKFLLSALELFISLCSEMDMLALSKLGSILLRLSLDTAITSNSRLSFTIEHLISSLLNLSNEDSASHVYNRILTDATNHLQDSKLQALLLSHIPPTGTRASQLRKTLADVFLLGPSTVDLTSNLSTATFTDLAKHISTSPTFNLTRRHNSPPFDYSSLSALTCLLDISIGSGHSPSPPPSSSTSINPAYPDTKSFNSALDSLADQIHTLFVSIKDTGASHMRRTEAKDALQALYFRLLYSVRIGVRKKRHIFDVERKSNGMDKWVGRDGDVVREERRGGEFMKRFLAKREGGEHSQARG